MIQGKNLLPYFELANVTVEVGDGICSLVHIIEDGLICMPPAPENDEDQAVYVSKS